MTSAQYDAYQFLYKTKSWQARRLWQLHREPYCRTCTRKQRFIAATVADHIIPHRGNRRLFWDRNNLQSLCGVHHNDKTRQEQGGTIRAVIGDDGWPCPSDPVPLNVTTLHSPLAHPDWFRKVFVPLTIVCGAPGSGKSRYVSDHAGSDDLVICFDQIATRLLGSAHASLKVEQIAAVLRARNDMLADLMWQKAIGKWPRAWLIVSEPEAQWRQWWHDTLNPASIVVMMTPAALCKQRVAEDAVQGDVRTSDIKGLIDQWWRHYTAMEHDIEVTPSFEISL